VAAFDGAEDLLRTLFGFAAFRAGQAEIIETIHIALHQPLC